MNKCFDFHNFLLKISSFSSCAILKTVAIEQLKVCLSVSLNICLGCKSCKNLSIVTKITYVFHGCNLSLFTKNCERMLDTFYKATSKSWIFVSLMTQLWYVFKLCRCDLHTKTSQYTFSVKLNSVYIFLRGISEIWMH